MSRFGVFLCVLLALWLVLVGVFLTPEAPGAHGVVHEQHAAMLQGGAAISSSRLVFLGWAFGALQIVLFVMCMTIGIRRPPATTSRDARWGQRSLVAVFGAGVLAFFGVFTAMVLADREATLSGTLTFLGPFPAATTWMLFGLWAAPLLFVSAYVFGFSQWILGGAALDPFEQRFCSGQSVTPGAQAPCDAGREERESDGRGRNSQ